MGVRGFGVQTLSPSPQDLEPTRKPMPLRSRLDAPNKGSLVGFDRVSHGFREVSMGFSTGFIGIS